MARAQLALFSVDDRLTKHSGPATHRSKGGAGFESAIWGWLVSPASRPLNFFYFMYQFWIIYGLDELRLDWCAL
jgi:hypothetical protein